MSKEKDTLNKSASLVLRFSGLLFFIITMISVREVLEVGASSFLYILDGGQAFWSVFFIFSFLLYASSFLLELLASGTALFFGGKNGYTQSVWNCAFYSVVSLALYTSLQLVTGLDSESQFILVTSIVMEIIFSVIILVCLKDSENFSWKKIFSNDANSKLCRRVFLIMLALVTAGCFIYANITFDKIS